MSTYTATIRWTRDPDTDFARGQYSRTHNWSFDGGISLAASASPHIVPTPWSSASRIPCAASVSVTPVDTGKLESVSQDTSPMVRMKAKK